MIFDGITQIKRILIEKKKSTQQPFLTPLSNFIKSLLVFAMEKMHSVTKV